MRPISLPVAWRDAVLIILYLAAALITGASVSVAPKAVALAIAAVATVCAVMFVGVRLVAVPGLLPGTVAVTSLILMRLPVLVGSPAASAAAILPFVAAGFVAGPRRHPMRTIVVAALAAYVGLLGIELLRGALSGNYSTLARATGSAAIYASVGWFAYRFVSASADASDRKRRLAQIALAPGVYAIANAALHLANVTNDIEIFSAAVGAPAEMLAALGISTTRVSFPLAVSINSFGVLCAAGLVSSGALALKSTVFPRWIPLAAAAACVYCMLRGDSRGPLLIGVLLLVLVVAFGRFRGARTLAIVAPVSSLLVIAVLGSVASSPLVANVSGPGRDVATGSGRTEIWGAAWTQISSGSLENVLGYGAGGQITSGVSRTYAFVFEGQERGDEVHAHNAFLQQIFDGGLVGALILAAAFFFILSGLRREQGAEDAAEASALMAAATALLLGGFTESVPSYLAPETVALMLFLIAAAAARPKPAGTDVEGPKSASRRDAAEGSAYWRPSGDSDGSSSEDHHEDAYRDVARIGKS